MVLLNKVICFDVIAALVRSGEGKFRFFSNRSMDTQRHKDTSGYPPPEGFALELHIPYLLASALVSFLEEKELAKAV